MIDVFNTCIGLRQLGPAYALGVAVVGALGALGVEQQAEPLVELEFGSGWLIVLALQRPRHAAQAEVLQCVVEWLVQHASAP